MSMKQRRWSDCLFHYCYRVFAPSRYQRFCTCAVCKKMASCVNIHEVTTVNREKLNRSLITKKLNFYFIFVTLSNIFQMLYSLFRLKINLKKIALLVRWLIYRRSRGYRSEYSTHKCDYIHLKIWPTNIYTYKLTNWTNKLRNASTRVNNYIFITTLDNRWS